MFAVDTNIFLYGHFDLFPRHPKARDFCSRLLGSAEDWCIGWQVVYEYLRVTTHPAVLKQPLTLAEAMADLDPYLGTGSVHILTHTHQHRPVLQAVADAVATARGNFVHDVHYAALLKEHGVSRIYTADSDFSKFGFLEVVDPTL